MRRDLCPDKKVDNDEEDGLIKVSSENVKVK